MRAPCAPLLKFQRGSSKRVAAAPPPPPSTNPGSAPDKGGSLLLYHIQIQGQNTSCEVREIGKIHQGRSLRGGGGGARGALSISNFQFLWVFKINYPQN